MKCHTHTKLPHLQGCGLHDWHAEVLAIRAFNRFLVDECADLAAGTLGQDSAWLKWKSAADYVTHDEGATTQPFKLREDVSIHMFVSEAPCGDASMELTMAKQEDATPWSSHSSSSGTDMPTMKDDSPVLNSPQQVAAPTMHGRGHFDQLGSVRRKPSRPDAPPTLSKSCSDKIAMKQCTGLLSAVTSQLVWPGNVYLKSLILPESEYVPEACERAFGRTGRMAPLAEKGVQERWMKNGFSFLPFDVQTTKREFEYSKRHIMLAKNASELDPVPSNRSCVWTPRRSEVLINGVLEGRRWYDLHGASILSRRSMWKSALGIAVMLSLPNLAQLTRKGSYRDLKASGALEDREQVKADVRRLALKRWVKNDGDDEWSLDHEERSAIENTARDAVEW